MDQGGEENPLFFRKFQEIDVRRLTFVEAPKGAGGVPNWERLMRTFQSRMRIAGDSPGGSPYRNAQFEIRRAADENRFWSFSHG